MALHIPKIKTPHINIKLILKLVAAAVALFAIAAVIGLVVHKYQADVTAKDNQRKAELVAAEKKGYEKGISDRNQYQAAYELMRVECQRGAKNYGLLTASQKRTAQAVNCEQPVLQFPATQ